MTDEIASFKVTAADIQKQKVHPSGDVHMQKGSHFIPLVFIFNFMPHYHGINYYHLIANKIMHGFYIEMCWLTKADFLEFVLFCYP